MRSKLCCRGTRQGRSAAATPIASSKRSQATANSRGATISSARSLRRQSTSTRRSPRRQRSFDLGGRISEFLLSLTPRTLAWSATAAAVAILVQAAVIATVVVKDQGVPSGPSLASAPSDGSFVVVRFAPQATANDITNFLGAYKATVVEGPLNMGGQLYRIRLSETKLPKDEVGKIVRQMQAESKVVGFIAARE